MDCVDGNTTENNDSYEITDNKLCFIINNEEFEPRLRLQSRMGTSKDFAQLKVLFQNLNFTIENYKNCSAKEIEKNFKKCKSFNFFKILDDKFISYLRLFKKWFLTFRKKRCFA